MSKDPTMPLTLSSDLKVSVVLTWVVLSPEKGSNSLICMTGHC